MPIDQGLVVDSHVHLWDRARLSYTWLDSEDASLQRDFLPDDFLDDVSAVAPGDTGRPVPSMVVVQAADHDLDQTLAEAAWVHRLAEAGAPIRAVVAHAPLEQGRRCESTLERLTGLPLVSGVRRLLQDEPEGFCLSPDFLTGTRLLARYGLSSDLCVRQHQLDEVADLIERCPEVVFVLDHLGKPVMDVSARPAWTKAISRLARMPNVRCKLSGLPHRRTAEDVRPWLALALEIFGPDRCLFGSDWPVLTGASTYAVWWEIVTQTIDCLAPGTRDGVLGAHARSTYDPARRGDRAKDS